jgi:putative DNA primase/helicase
MESAASSEAVRQAIDRLASLDDPIEYALERKRVATATGINQAQIDQFVESHRKRQTTETREQTLFPPVAAWPDPIDPGALIEEIRSFLTRHMSMHEAQVTAVALWVLHAWTHSESDVSPILAIHSPEKRCGKTTLLNCLLKIVPRPLPTAYVTPAALFRSIEKWAPTLLIDEADTFLRGNTELRGVLNSGHARLNAQLIRCVGDGHEVQTFKTWAPKAIASIGRLPETLVDRSILIRLQRKLNGDSVSRLSDMPQDELVRLQRQCAAFRDQHGTTLNRWIPAVPAAVNDRATDNWRPLLQIAHACANEQAALEAMHYIEAHNADEDRDALGTQALADLQALFSTTAEDSLSTTTILENLLSLDERPWADYRSGNAISAQQLARLLKPYGVRPRQIKRYNTNLRGYRRDELEDSFRRYLPAPEEGATPLPAADSLAAWVADYDAAPGASDIDATSERRDSNGGSGVASRSGEDIGGA